MYASKTLIFKMCPGAGTLAAPSRKLSGLAVLVPDAFGALECTATLTNASPALFGEWKIILHLGGKVYTRVMSKLFEFKFSLGVGSARHIDAASAIIVLDAGESRLLCAAYASTFGELNPAFWLMPFARNTVALKGFARIEQGGQGQSNAAAQMPEGEASFQPPPPQEILFQPQDMHDQQSEITEYEKFMQNTKNYYENETPAQNFAAASESVQSFSAPREQGYTSQNATINNYSRAFKSFFDSQKQRGEYFNIVQNEINDIFQRFPPYLPLCEKIENSAWVKIDNVRSKKFFLLGLVVRGESPQYICYALPAHEARLSRPGTEYISASDGETYYILYQDAQSGKIRK